MMTFSPANPTRLAAVFLIGCQVCLIKNSTAFADIYPVKGVWVAPNRDFPIGPGEICSSIRLSGVEAVSRRLISELLIFNENKRHVIKQNTQTVSTLISTKATEGGYWITEFTDTRRRLWFRQKINYLLTIVDPTTIEIRSNTRKTSFMRCGPKGRFPI
jgi:hypothetical protein